MFYYSISLGTLVVSIAFNEASNAAINDASIILYHIFAKYSIPKSFPIIKFRYYQQ